MKDLRIHRFLYEVFGETQHVLSLGGILALGAAGCAAFGWLGAPFLRLVGPLRAALALLLAFDIAAGCAANFTRGTSDYYAKRPVHRLVFITIHLHLPALTLLSGMAFLPSLAAWAYTIAATFLVNALNGRRSQPAVAGFLLAIGAIALFLVPACDAQRLISLLFLIKLAYGFAVDHYRGVLADNGATEAR
jgi:hypothetical protein